MSKLIEDLNWRYATRKFDPSKKIAESDFSILKEVLSLVPTSNGLQPYKFLIIENPEIRKQLRGKSWDQPQITDASHLVLFCAYIDLTETHVDAFIDLHASERAVASENLQGYRTHLKRTVSSLPVDQKTTSNEKQAYIALGHLLHAAAQMRIDSSPIEGFEPEGYDEILGLSAKNLKATVICALGYRAEDDPSQHLKKVRKPPNDLFEVI